MQVAEESLLDLPGLAFKGKAYQDVRTAMNHASREGVEAAGPPGTSARRAGAIRSPSSRRRGAPTRPCPR